MEFFHPRSFTIEQSATHNPEIGPFIYYSFVTLTTLGYGDTIPLIPPARSFSFVEAVIGQIYLAVLIARLVGLHIVHSSKKNPH